MLITLDMVKEYYVSKLNLTDSQVGMYKFDLDMIFKDIEVQYFDNETKTTEASMEDITQFTNAVCDSLCWFYHKVGEVK
jgi:hypothetical protein